MLYGTYQVFLQAEVDPVLAPDGRVYHAQECCRDEAEAGTPHVNGGYKPGNVRYHTATNAQQHRFAMCLVHKQLLYDNIDRLELFVFLAGRYHDAWIHTFQLGVQAGNCAVCNNDAMLFKNYVLQVCKPGFVVVLYRSGTKCDQFGHTVGHAIETLYNISHGQAISLGMLLACKVSEAVTGLDPEVYYKLAALLEQYKLPSVLTLHPDKLMDILVMDKKRNGNEVDYIVLNSIGRASIQTISFDVIRTALENFPHAGNH